MSKYPEFGGIEKEFSPEPIEAAFVSVASEEHPDRNEDSVLFDKAHSLFAVFDGMGGHAAGEVASSIAQKYVGEKLAALPRELEPEEIRKSFDRILEGANQMILEKSRQSEEKKGMGTTATVLKLWQSESGEERAVIGNLGDSRVYRLTKEGTLEQATLDDSLARERLGPKDAMELEAKFGNLTSLEALSSSEKTFWHLRNVITNNLGRERAVPRTQIQNLDNVVALLITSDGIHDNLIHDEIAEILKNKNNPEEAAHELVLKARERSRDKSHPRAKPDDMSAIVVLV